jgi:hypothetical protein
MTDDGRSDVRRIPCPVCSPAHTSLHGHSQRFQPLLTLQRLSVLGVPSLTVNPRDGMKTRCGSSSLSHSSLVRHSNFTLCILLRFKLSLSIPGKAFEALYLLLTSNPLLSLLGLCSTRVCLAALHVPKQAASSFDQ